MRNRPLLSCFILIATQVAIGRAVTNNDDGTGGTPPAIYQYVMLNGDISNEWIGFDPHSAHGVVTQDNGYILTGSAMVKEVANAKSTTFITRIDLCSDISKYESALGVNLERPGTNCANRFTWSWRDPATTKNAKIVWIALSPDGSYVLAVGVKEGSTSKKHQRYVVKLNAQTGALIWSFLMPTGAGFGLRSGYETIAFSEDGGFIVGGYGTAPDTTFPSFKSGGTVDEGQPILQKFSAATASASTMPSAPIPVWSYICQAAGVSCVTQGSSKALRIYHDGGVEKVVTVPGARASIIVIDATTGAELQFKEYDTFGEGNGDGTASDIEVEINAAGQVASFVTTGLDFNQIYQDGTDGCPSKGCASIKGRFTKYSSDLSKKEWETRFNNFPGGKYQFAGLTEASEAIIYTECFGITKVRDTSGSHVGYIASCGQGIEGCNGMGTSESITNSCKKDPRRDWRGVTIRIGLDGEIVWYTMDNAKFNGEKKVMSTAAEYVLTRPDGKTVVITDETYGFGVITYDCEAGVNCPGTSSTTSTTVSTPTSASTTSTPTVTSPEDNCENINIIAPSGGPYGKVNSNSKYPLGGISARSVQIRYNFVEPIWKKSYLGFLTFTKFMCGADFITAINDGRVSFDVLDKTAAYDSVKQFNHLTKTGVTIQFYHEQAGASSTDFGSAKKDTMYILLSGLDQVAFGNKDRTNCFEKAKVDIIKEENNVADGQTDLSQCVANKY